MKLLQYVSHTILNIFKLYKSTVIMVLINREMRENAESFILRWRGTKAERAEAQTFTNEFSKSSDLTEKI